MLELALAGSVAEWRVDLDRLPIVADFVAQVTRERYPRLDVPMHSRWRHFTFAGRDLWHEISARAPWPDTAARARAAFDLAITSVLLDAGAGPQWRFHDAATGVTASRSEGLALASLRWFERGGFAASEGARAASVAIRSGDMRAASIATGSGDMRAGAESDARMDVLRVDAAALRRIDASALSAAFQVDETNPLVGAEGRAALLNRLGAAIETRPDLFARVDSPRPGGLFDAFARSASAAPLRAGAILETVLDAFSTIWEGRPSLAGIALGDCWPHPAIPYVPLHKLSQWLTYSLIEPLQEAGIDVAGLDELTGLPEYRNGGLLVDMGVLVPRDPSNLSATHPISDPFVVGWRALTVALLDQLAPLVGMRLGLENDASLLARVLEGGTWAAGRRIAREKRADGGPPFHIASDGTVL
jgi:uncharacterized protein DUF1688